MVTGEARVTRELKMWKKKKEPSFIEYSLVDEDGRSVEDDDILGVVLGFVDFWGQDTVSQPSLRVAKKPIRRLPLENTTLACCQSQLSSHGCGVEVRDLMQSR